MQDFVKIHLKKVLSLIHIEYLNELTTFPLFHRFIKDVLCYNFNEIGENLVSVFFYFWNTIKSEIDNYVAINIQVLGAKKIINLTEAVNCVNKLLEHSKDVQNKNIIYDEILKCLNITDKLLKYDHEEDILNLLIFVINDIKLIPNEYINSLDKIFEALDKTKSNMIEHYHIKFILSFISNIKHNDYYKNRIIYLIEIL